MSNNCHHYIFQAQSTLIKTSRYVLTKRFLHFVDLKTGQYLVVTTETNEIVRQDYSSVN